MDSKSTVSSARTCASVNTESFGSFQTICFLVHGELETVSVMTTTTDESATSRPIHVDHILVLFHVLQLEPLS